MKPFVARDRDDDELMLVLGEPDDDYDILVARQDGELIWMDVGELLFVRFFRDDEQWVKRVAPKKLVPGEE